MRIWTLHPKYLDPQGLVALWRETLLAQAVLRGKTKGYTRHPQLARFNDCTAPLSAINAYLTGVLDEAVTRRYAFNADKVGPVRTRVQLDITAGQLMYEWQHLLRKLRVRNPAAYRRWRGVESPQPYPLFRVIPGVVESWERVVTRRST